MRRWTVIALSAVVCAAAVVGFYYLYEEYEEEIWLGESFEARRNPFLAAQRFLTEKNIEVFEESAKLEFGQLSPGDVVFLSEVDSILVSKSQIDAAMSWIESGGSMVVGVGRESVGYDSLLSRFDIDVVESKYDFAEALLGDEENAEMTPSERMREINRRARERKAKAKKESNQNRKPMHSDGGSGDLGELLLDLLDLVRDKEYYKVKLSDDAEEVHLASLDRIVFDHPLIYADYEDLEYEDDSDWYDYELVANIPDEDGQRIIQFSYGQGKLTAISSSKLWENDYIGLADHAFFLSQLSPEGSRLHFFYNFDVPSLWDLLKKYFYELLIVLGVLIVLWVWRRGQRVQREILNIDGQRRNFDEHLHAAAKFLVGNKQYKPLVTSLKEDIDLQMRPFYPGFAQLNDQARAAMLVERTGLPEELIQSWVRFCENVNSQEELLAALKIGNVIRKKL